MPNLLRYSHLTAKIRAMKGKMLTADDYAQLLQKRNVRDVALYLKSSTYYKDALVDLNENDVHRGYLEILFYKSIISDALKIEKYLQGGEKAIYRYVYRKQEVEDLKKMLRTLAMGKSLSQIDRKILFISRYSKIDFNTALTARTMRDLVESLRGTRFFARLNPLLESNGHMDLFAAEMALDTYYYDRIFEQIKKYAKGEDKELLKKAFRMEVDTRNLLMIYRGKKYYEVGKETLYMNLLPYFGKIKKSDFEEMIEANTAEEAVALMMRCVYGKFMQFEQNDWEKQFNQNSQQKLNHQMHAEQFTIIPIIGYIFMKEMEIMNITTIVEGIRYNASPLEIKNMLIGTMFGKEDEQWR